MTTNKVSAPGTMASDEFPDVATADLDHAEQGMARGAMRELDAMQAQRKSHERESDEFSHAPSRNSGHIPSIRTGVARILNAAAEAVEEYLDVEEDEDKVPEIPDGDDFEGMRAKVESFIAEIEAKDGAGPNRPSMDASSLSVSDRGQSLRSRGRSIPGIAQSSTEQFNESVGRNKSLPDSPFLRSRLQKQAFGSGPRQLLNEGEVAFDKREVSSFEVMGRDRVRESVLSSSTPRAAFNLPPRHRGAPQDPYRAPRAESLRLSDGRPTRAFAHPAPFPQPSRPSLASAPSQGLGTIEEIRYGDAGQLVRRRITLPWQLTLTFGCVTVIGCLAGLTTLGIAIRNVIYLNGPKAGPQIPDVIEGLDQILALLKDPQLNLSSGR